MKILKFEINGKEYEFKVRAISYKEYYDIREKITGKMRVVGGVSDATVDVWKLTKMITEASVIMPDDLNMEFDDLPMNIASQLEDVAMEVNGLKGGGNSFQ